MSKKTFSQLVKDELCEVKINSGEARAELASMILFGENTDNGKMIFKTDKANIAARIQFVLKKVTGEEIPIDITNGRKNFCIEINSDITDCAGVYYTDGGEIEFDEDVYEEESFKKAFLRGAFIISGTITDPMKGYSSELITYNENMSYLAVEILENFGIKSNTVKRNSNYVTYLKDRESVGDFLSIIGAHKMMMELIVAHIQKDMNNRNNRASNCLTANMDKAIAASVTQCNAIMKLQKTPFCETLDEEKKTLAQLRLDNFDLSLTALGEKMSPRMTKSSVNRRFTKLIELADKH